MVPDRPDDLADVDVLEGAFGHLVPDHLVGRLDAQRQPADARPPEQVQVVGLHGVNAEYAHIRNLRPRSTMQIEQRLEIALVQEEHLVRDAQGLDAEPRRASRIRR